MYLLFLDESGTPPKPDKAVGSYLVIGGVIVPEGAWHAMAKGLSELKRKYKVSGEVKWKHFGRGNSDTKSAIKHLSSEDKDKFRDEVFALITARKAIKLLACVTSAEAAYNRPTIINQDDVYRLAYKGITERFQYFLQDASKEVGSQQFGLIISDHRMAQDDDKLRKHHHDLVDFDGDFSSAYRNVVESIHFSPSHFSAGLQLADMVAGAVHRYFQHRENRFAKKLLGSFRKSPDGKIAGYGLVKMPARDFIEPGGEPSGGGA